MSMLYTNAIFTTDVMMLILVVCVHDAMPVLPDAHFFILYFFFSNKYGPVSKGLVFGVATAVIWPPLR